MVFVGSDDGVYRVDEDGVAQTLRGGRVMRLRRLAGYEGLFAATTEGLYHSVDGETWRDLGLDEQAYAVGVGPDRERLYAGTRPAALYAADGLDGDWTALPGFQELPSRDEWRLPRHENLAQVRDVLADGSRLVAGVEVGGVHVSTDGGATWTERRDGVDDDVHELHVRGPGEYAAATGGGLYTSDDAGRTWTRLDEGVDQWYFRRVLDVGGTLYAAGAIAPSGTWNDPDADPALFASDGDLRHLPLPDDSETVTGMAAVDGTLVAATHRGSVLRRVADGWERLGEVPTPADVSGRYTPVAAR